MEHTGQRLSPSYRGATHIVKLWEQNEFPQLAANEYFCLAVAHILIALNCALRNGEAHLKNFGIVCDDVQGEARSTIL